MRRKRLGSLVTAITMAAFLLLGFGMLPVHAADPPTQVDTQTIQALSDALTKLTAKHEATVKDYEQRITQLEHKFAGDGGRIDTTTSTNSITGFWLTSQPSKTQSPQVAIYTEKRGGTQRAIVGAYGTGDKSKGLMICLCADKEGSIQFVDTCGKVIHLTAGDVRKLKALLAADAKPVENNAAVERSSPGVATFDRRSESLAAGLFD